VVAVFGRVGWGVGVLVVGVLRCPCGVCRCRGEGREGLRGWFGMHVRRGGVVSISGLGRAALIWGRCFFYCCSGQGGLDWWVNWVCVVWVSWELGCGSGV